MDDRSQIPANRPDPYYRKALKPPRTMAEGLVNFVQMAINDLVDGNMAEAVFKLVDLQSDLCGKHGAYAPVLEGLQQTVNRSDPQPPSAWIVTVTGDHQPTATLFTSEAAATTYARTLMETAVELPAGNNQNLLTLPLAPGKAINVLPVAMPVPTVWVEVSGGVVSDVYSPHTPLQVSVIDYDTEGAQTGITALTGTASDQISQHRFAARPQAPPDLNSTLPSCVRPCVQTPGNLISPCTPKAWNDAQPTTRFWTIYVTDPDDGLPMACEDYPTLAAFLADTTNPHRASAVIEDPHNVLGQAQA